MGNFQERLRQIMEETGVKAADISRATGISTAAISKYLSDKKKEPNASYVMKIAKFFNVASEWLYGFTDIRKPFYESSIMDTYEKLSDIGKKEVCDFASYLLHKEMVFSEEKANYELPLLGLTAAGPGVLPGDPSRETITIHDIPKGADFALTVKGDSMEPLIKNGSIIFVKQQPIVENGEMAVVDVDGEVTCKKVYLLKDTIELRSINPKYGPMRPTQARIIGKVILQEEMK
ncbi:MAG: XRE family transcriptional regulator [Bacillota bacterium]